MVFIVEKTTLKILNQNLTPTKQSSNFLKQRKRILKLCFIKLKQRDRNLKQSSTKLESRDRKLKQSFSIKVLNDIKVFNVFYKN